jgi:uncharacterized protein (TIRG00374 family)
MRRELANGRMNLEGGPRLRRGGEFGAPDFPVRLISAPAARWVFAGAMLGMLAFPFLIGGKAAIDGLARLGLGDYLGILAFVVIGWCAHAFKVRSLLEPLGSDVSGAAALRATLAADVGFLLTPGGVGGYATSVYYLRRIGATANSAVAVMSADQASDAIFFAIAVPLAGLAAAAAIPHAPSSWTISLATALAALAIALLVWRSRSAHGHARSISWMRSPWWKRAREFVSRVIDDLRRLLEQDRTLLLRTLLLTSLQQLCRYGALWLIFRGLGYPISFARVLLAQTLVVQAASLTGIPAGGGVAEVGLTAAFAGALPPAAMASALLLWRAATLYLGLICGLAAMLSLSSDTKVPSMTDPATDAEPADRRGAERRPERVAPRVPET